MSLPDATAGTQLTKATFQVAWLAWLDFDGDPVRACTAPRTIIFGTGTGDSDLDGQTFTSVDPTMVSVTDVKNAEGGADTVSFTMSGITGPDTDLLNMIGNPALWRGRTARLWALIYDETGVQKGAAWAVYTGRMSAVQIVGDPSGQTVKVDVESYLASFKKASGRTYLDQASFDATDTTAKLKIGLANGAVKGVSDGAPSGVAYDPVVVPF